MKKSEKPSEAFVQYMLREYPRRYPLEAAGVHPDVIKESTPREKSKLKRLAMASLFGPLAKDRKKAQAELRDAAIVIFIRSMRPEDRWFLNVERGKFQGYTSVEHTLDRFRHVFPNTVKQWDSTKKHKCLPRLPSVLTRRIES